MVVDLFLVYQFIRRLVTPFEKWEAYKLGIIDAKGNILIRRKDFTKIAERKAFGIFDRLVLNLKRLLGKLPLGQTRIASYAAALWLIKEEQRMLDAGLLNEDYELDDIEIETRLQAFLDEYGEIIAEANKNEMTGVGSGAIAGLGVGPQGEPGLTPAQQKKYKKKNFKQLMLDIKPKS